MNLVDIFLLALRNLRQSTLRATLTAIGVVVGVASIVCMVSFGLGLQDNILNQALAKFDVFTTIPVTGASVSAMLEMNQSNNADEAEAADVGPGQGGGPDERRQRAFASASKRQPKRLLDDKAVAEIAAIPGVDYVYARIGFSGIVQFSGHTRQFGFSGAPLDLARLPGTHPLLAGAGFSSDNAEELLVGESLLRAFADKAAKPSASGPRRFLSDTDKREAAAKLIGREVVLLTLRDDHGLFGESEPDPLSAQYERHVFRIVGVLGTDNAPGPFSQFMGGSGNLFVPMGTARRYSQLNADPLSRMGQLLLGDTGYQMATVKVKSPEQTQAVFDHINSMGLSAISLTQHLSQVKFIFIVINCSLALLAGISLFVAAIGISNTLIMSITERTREIGIMKAVGGDDRTIMAIFFTEAGLLGLLGGLMGLALGCFVDFSANAIVNRYIAGAGGRHVDFFQIPLYLSVGSVLFAVGVSLLAAAWPARRAAKVDPIKALRHD